MKNSRKHTSCLSSFTALSVYWQINNDPNEWTLWNHLNRCFPFRVYSLSDPLKKFTANRHCKKTWARDLSGVIKDILCYFIDKSLALIIIKWLSLSFNPLLFSTPDCFLSFSSLDWKDGGRWTKKAGLKVNFSDHNAHALLIHDCLKREGVLGCSKRPWMRLVTASSKWLLCG